MKGILLIASFFFVVFVAPVAAQITVDVCESGCNATNIRSALTNLSLGDIILLEDDLNEESILFTYEFLTLDCQGHTVSGTGGSGLLVTADSITVTDCIFEDFDTALLVRGTTGVNITDTTFKNNNIGIELIFDNDLTIDTITVSNNSIGIQTQNLTNSLVQDSTFTQQADHALVLFSSKNNRLLRNTLNDNYGDALIVNQSSQTALETNTIRNNSQGILFEHSSDNTLFDNIIRNNNRGVVLSQSSKRNVIKENTIRFNHEFGISLENKADSTTLTHNAITDNNFTGLLIADSSFSHIENNEISVTVETSIRITGGTHNLLSNTVQRNTNGIVLSDGSFSLYNNTVCDNTGTDIDGIAADGKENICDTTVLWKDVGFESCQFDCSLVLTTTPTTQDNTTNSTQPPEPAQDNTLLFIVIGIVAVIAIVIVILIKKKKGGSSSPPSSQPPESSPTEPPPQSPPPSQPQPNPPA